MVGIALGLDVVLQEGDGLDSGDVPVASVEDVVDTVLGERVVDTVPEEDVVAWEEGVDIALVKRAVSVKDHGDFDVLVPVGNVNYGVTGDGEVE